MGLVAGVRQTARECGGYGIVWLRASGLLEKALAANAFCMIDSTVLN